MANLFSHVRMARPPKNKFDLSHERKMSLQMGNLVPIMVQEIVPGDKFRVQSEVFLRMAPMLAPIMHRVNVTTHYFFVPNRLVWNEWEDFITGGRDGLAAPVAPYMTADTLANNGGTTAGSLADYMGLPTMAFQVDPHVPIQVSALPFRAYQLIYDEYYRDQNLTAPVTEAVSFRASGEVFGTPANVVTTMRKRAWEKDYFTSALPWSQRGGEVNVPLSGTADVTYLPHSKLFNEDGTAVVPGTLTSSNVNTPGETTFYSANQTSKELRVENIDSVDLDSATGVSINELRRSVRLQEWLEKNARGGARYTESNLVHFGVRSSDARLQRPEYLGGGRNPMVISEVLSTFQDAVGEGEPQGNMAGHGVSMGRTNGFSRFFEEHGYVIGLISITPRTAYQQGIPKHFMRFDKLDYYWPSFANIGEQEIAMKELYYTGATGTTPEVTFGYTPRYAEYKYGCSSVHGEFRTTQSFWHMARIFQNQPALNTNFVEADPTQRIFAVEDGNVHKIYAQIFNRVDALRPMPYFGTPTL